jgi:hypothetical protein
MASEFRMPIVSNSLITKTMGLALRGSRKVSQIKKARRGNMARNKMAFSVVKMPCDPHGRHLPP